MRVSALIPKYPEPETYLGRTHYCPGCGHGILHKILGEVIDELGIRKKVILIEPIGCSVLALNYLKVDGIQGPHGRAPAIATAVKRLRPENIVITYQGDGDLAAIGTNEILHAANRGELFTVIFINNAVYGMTGGQMAPTTLIGQKSTTTPTGRKVEYTGYPLRICELLNTLEAPVYLERVSLHDVEHILQTKAAIKKALLKQIEKRGFSLVEVLSNCPTNWKMSPEESWEFVKNEMVKIFPLGVFRDK
ncbi:MAG TPA: 2-oxoglutarate oxidoreductase [Candidatus Desulfofervidus auxilii]|uniref:2-oxoglutarate oxidoreductase n=1 Tax=Desulfofervidus auxilii TaxID=1621989 RepID=A0A7C0U1E7_DESA2|nr:thiamine pyrophosphate-dependent enzyme [Candidatus Desulfofervidus auxilii]HDD43439.1 2-oxoglutarate oxidoreductase [Candidatus Desulfofervidus auxilii]